MPELGDYQRFLVGKLLKLPIVREVRSNIAIQTLARKGVDGDPFRQDERAPPGR